jgi:hypothetical protein
MIRMRNVVALAIVLLGLHANALWAQYQLYTVNTGTGAGTFSSACAVGYPFGLAFQPTTGKLYTWDGSNINEINKATGAILSTIPNFSTTDYEEGDLAFNSLGIGFLMALWGDDVCQFNVATSTFTIKGFGGQADDINGLAFDAGNVLYGYSASSGKVYTINQVTGAFTLVGNSGVKGYSAGMCFDGAGNLFLAVAPFAGPSNFYTVNKGTGVATLVGLMGINGLVGLSFDAASGTVYALGQAGAPVPGVKVTVPGGAITIKEGGAGAPYNIVLNTLPTNNVMITINPPPLVSVAPPTLTFTPGTWNIAQTVTVSAIDDGVFEGLRKLNITHTAASLDPAYNGIAVANVLVNLKDTPSGEGSLPGCQGPPPSYVLPPGEGVFGMGNSMLSPPLAPQLRDFAKSYPGLRGPIPYGDQTYCVVNVSYRQQRHTDPPKPYVPSSGMPVAPILVGLALAALLGAAAVRYRMA